MKIVVKLFNKFSFCRIECEPQIDIKVAMNVCWCAHTHTTWNVYVLYNVRLTLNKWNAIYNNNENSKNETKWNEDDDDGACGIDDEDE